jgi:uncharacterized tellurite resistance protein B-like protein
MIARMSISDRIVPVCDLLLGAAYADEELRQQEKDEVRALVQDLAGEVPAEVDARIAAFDPAKFDLAKAAEPFRGDSEDDRRRLLVLVSAIIEADEEIDLREDDYLRDLAKALALPASALAGLTVEVEAEELKETFVAVRKGPPPPPKKAMSVDVDMD